MSKIAHPTALAILEVSRDSKEAEERKHDNERGHFAFTEVDSSTFGEARCQEWGSTQGSCILESTWGFKARRIHHDDIQLPTVGSAATLMHGRCWTRRSRACTADERIAFDGRFVAIRRGLVEWPDRAFDWCDVKFLTELMDIPHSFHRSIGTKALTLWKGFVKICTQAGQGFRKRGKAAVTLETKSNAQIYWLYALQVVRDTRSSWLTARFG